MSEKAYIVGAVRTPGGKKNGSLSQWHPADMGAVVLDELVKITGIDPKDIDDVIFGCVDQVGAQSGNVARNAILSSSLPESVPGTSVDRQCGSSQQAIHFAIQAVMSGTQDVVVGGGVALVQAAKALANVTGENSDQEAGVGIVRRALESPLRQIAENAGVDGAVVAGKVRESDDNSFGFNAQTEEYGDLFSLGVIDPAKVTRTALEDAASIAGLLITTEAMVAERPAPAGAAGGGMPDMGGMGGMGGMM